MPQADDLTITQPSRRITLLGGAAVVLTAGGELNATSVKPDAGLLALAAELRAAEAGYGAAVAADDDAAIAAAGDRVNLLLERMADVPAAGFAGVAAKVGRIAASALAEPGGLMDGEIGLLGSIEADLRRLVPAAVPALTVEKVRNSAAPAEPSPEPAWALEQRAEAARLAALGLLRERGGGFTVGDLQVVGWLLWRIETAMGRAVAERVRELSTIPASEFGPEWQTLLDRHLAGDAPRLA